MCKEPEAAEQAALAEPERGEPAPPGHGQRGAAADHGARARGASEAARTAAGKEAREHEDAQHGLHSLPPTRPPRDGSGRPGSLDEASPLNAEDLKSGFGETDVFRIFFSLRIQPHQMFLSLKETTTEFRPLNKYGWN